MFACPLGHSTGNVENPFWVGHCTQDTGGGEGDREEWSLDRHGGEKTKEAGTTCYEERESSVTEMYAVFTHAKIDTPSVTWEDGQQAW